MLLLRGTRTTLSSTYTAPASTLSLNHAAVEVVLGLHNLKDFRGRNHLEEATIIRLFQLCRLNQ